MNSAARFLRERSRDSRGLLYLAIALGSLAGALWIGQAWLLAEVVHRQLFEPQGSGGIVPMMWGIAGLFVLRALLVHGSERLSFAAAARIKQQLRTRLLDKLGRLGPLHLSGENSAEWTTLATDGVEALEGYFARFLPAMSLALWIPLAILVFVLPVSGRSALIMIATAPLIPFFMVLIGRGTERLNQQQWRKLARLSARFLDALQGLTSLKLFNATRREARLMDRLSDEYRRATMSVLRVAFISSLALEFLATVSIAMIAVLLGFALLFGQIEFRAAFFVLLLAPEFYLPLRSLGTHYHARMEAVAAAERMVDLLQRPEPRAIEGGITFRPEGLFGLKLESLGYSYEDRPALRELSFDMKAGERIALVGPSGAGKSTLVQLLLGFMAPGEGSIRIGGTSAGWLDLQDLELASWHRQLAWVPQQPRLFAGTVADNLCLGLESLDVDVDESALRGALQQASALEFVEALPKGLQTRVGEGGQGLSGGQRQRLALARAFLRQARLLIFDEPTAHLDYASQQAVNKALDRLAGQCSQVLVAHRLATVRNCDRILVMDQGRVVQQGTHEFLVEQEGLYRNLVLAATGGRA